jgi:hypothetical protein
MYELSRVRLHGIGPKGARYQDVTLDLRHADGGEPAPATVLFLENGGGKTVLVRLIFSVILPGRRQVVGTTSSKVLEKFVLGGDVAHVALEWRDIQTGRLLVTGKASEWRGHVVSTDPTRLIEQWYTFRPTSTLDLATLPFTQDGRIVSLSGFRDRLSEAQEADPALQVALERGQRDWTEHLDSLQLDPELFSYQRKMNAGEGEAADAFRFKTDEAFVDWLLTAILPDEEPQGFGDLVSGYAETLAGRSDLMVERDFVAGALERLGPLVHAAGEKAAAESMHREAVADAERLVVALATREREEEERHRIQKELLDDVEASERRLDLDYKRLTSAIGELQRLVARLRWEQAVERRLVLEAKRDKAARLLEAWQATEILVGYQTAHESAETIRDLIGQKEGEARPFLQARDDAARRFVRQLIAMADGASAEADNQEALAVGLEGPIQAASDEQNAAVRAAATANAAIGHLEEKIRSVVRAIRAAVSAGLLADGDDVAEAAAAAETVADEAEARLTAALDELSALAGTRERVDGEYRDARTDLGEKTRIVDRLEHQVTIAHGRRDELTETSRLQDLLGSEDIVLDQDVPILDRLLTDAIERAAAEQGTLRMKAVADQRVLDALGSGGLLPPAEDVSSALRVLQNEGIICWSGWRYLSHMPADEREQVLERHPHIIDGIVLNCGDDLGSAEDLLTTARLLPRTVVAIGTSVALVDADSPPPADIAFIVPPNPAMYDEERAEEERREIQRCQDERSANLAELKSAIEADRGLLSMTRQWASDFPPGALGKLEADCLEAKASQNSAMDVERLHRDELGRLDKEAQRLRNLLPTLRQAARVAKDKADALRRLADDNGQVVGWQEASQQARIDADNAEKEAARHGARAEDLRGQQAEAKRTADSHRRNAEGYRKEVAGVEGGGSADEAMPVPEGSLESLRAAYRTAAEAYQAAEVGADLRAEEARRSSRESEARAALERVGDEVQQRATGLLLTPQGGDALARSEATASADRQLEGLRHQVTRAVEEASGLEAIYRADKSQERPVEPYGKPRDIAHGEQLIATATMDRQTTFRDWDEAKKRKETLTTQVLSLERLIGDFGAVRESLSTIVPEIPDRVVGPFRGDVEAAKGRRDSVRQSWGTATDLLEKARAEVRRVADLLAQHASDQRYAKAELVVRRQMVSVNRERLPEYAAEWESALRPRLRVITDELDQIERHRDAMIERLQGMVKHALSRLRAAQRASRLPEELGDWSGLEFLRISFTPPDDATLVQRLGEVIDEAAAKGKDKEAGKRDGLSILLNGVRASLRPKGVQVYMLKPDSVLRDERVRVSEIADVFSGGQLLTAAIILYCTMAWLRASERGQAQRPHAGVLFLDNPIGRASAGYLLELQLTVAKKLGVQLVYTTGLFDTNALSVFPLIIRLRNDADLRAGMKYLRVDEEIRRRLPGSAVDEMDVVTASRIFVRADGRAL